MIPIAEAPWSRFWLVPRLWALALRQSRQADFEKRPSSGVLSMVTGLYFGMI